MNDVGLLTILFLNLPIPIILLIDIRNEIIDDRLESLFLENFIDEPLLAKKVKMTIGKFSLLFCLKKSSPEYS